MMIARIENESNSIFLSPSANTKSIDPVEAIVACLPNTRIEQFGVPCDAASVLSILIGLGVIFGVVIVLWYFFGRKDPMKKLQETMRVEFAQYWSICPRCGGNELVRDKIFI